MRGGPTAISPPLLSSTFRKIEDGLVIHAGYVFRIWLPGPGGQPVGERGTGGVEATAIDTTAAEQSWCAYAWPVEVGVNGQRAFMMDQYGDVLASPNAEGMYSGPGRAPAPSAARRQGSSGKLDAPPAANAIGIDVQKWVVVH